ncbi:MAG: FtsX-like permease family protein [Luteitalea sp.]|nr:FtsX-like permease family protein [Luteitalea sp.]
MPFLDVLRRDVRYALTTLSKTPAFSISVILTLGLCIGLNTAIFSVVDHVLFRPLPFPDVDRLGLLALRVNEADNRGMNGQVWEIVRDRTTTVEAAPFGGSTGVNLVAGGQPAYVQQHQVAAGFFRTLGVTPVLGREFTSEDDRSGGAAAVMLSHDLWRRFFNGERNVVGRTLTLRGEPHTIVGVMPRSFQSFLPTDVWTPLRPSTTGAGAGLNYGILARARDDVTLAHAQAELQTLTDDVARARQMDTQQDVPARFTLAPLQRALTQELRDPLLILWSAVGAVLLIGCVNISGLLLARGAARRGEIATRLAIGAPRWSIVRQLLVESVVIAIAGGALGIVFGYFGLRVLRTLGEHDLRWLSSITLDARVLAVTAGGAFLCSFLFGLFPALQATRLDLRTALVEGGARGGTGRRLRARRVLVVAEVALGVVLLVAAGLALRTLMWFATQEPGFDTTNVVTAQLSLDDARYRKRDAIVRLYEESLRRIRVLPGVEGAAVAFRAPFERWANEAFDLPGTPRGTTDRQTNFNLVTPEYFEVLRIPLLRGRIFTDADGPSSQPVVVVSRSFVERFLPDGDPLGRHVRFHSVDRAIIGVVGDVQLQSGLGGGVGPLGPEPAVYTPVAQTEADTFALFHGFYSPSWIVRSGGAIGTLAPSMQRALATVDPLLPFAAFRTLADVKAETLFKQRFAGALFGTFGGLALLLVALGVGGLIAHTVTERRRELGIRMALGATTARAVRTAALPGIKLTLIGLVTGLGLSWLAMPLFEHLVWGIEADDPVAFTGVAAAVLVVAALASLIPSLRILRLDPADTLRQE